MVLKKIFAFSGLSIRFSISKSKRSNPKQFGTALSVAAPRPLALLPDLLRTITLFDAKKYVKSDSWLFALLNIITQIC